MSAKDGLRALDECRCRVGSNGLYVVDPVMYLLITDWKNSPLWGPIGELVLQYQGVSEGVDMASIMDGRPSLSELPFPGLALVDEKIRESFRDPKVDLMVQHHTGTVIIKVDAQDEYQIFTYAGEEIHISDKYVQILADLGAAVSAPDEEDMTLSVSAEPDIIGFLTRVEPETFVDDGSCEDIDECVNHLEQFESYYAATRRSPEYRRNPDSVMTKLKQDFLETLYSMGAYERHGDQRLNERVEGLMQEIFSSVLLRRGLQFPIRGRSNAWETAHPDRIQFLEGSGDEWYVFVSDWDNGYGDILGTHYPITREIASFLQRELPTLKVRA